MSTMIQARKLSVVFKTRRGWLQPESRTTVLDNISFKLEQGRILGIVGESGSGKTTLAKTILQVIQPENGELCMEPSLNTEKDIQFIYQDPVEALNPRMRIEELILEPLDYHDSGLSQSQRLTRLENVMRDVGLDFNERQRYPHEFSGGQCQRIGIARALISEPKILICDEPVSALDVSIRAQIINLLKELQQSRNLTLIFIAHDLSLVRYISDDLLVLFSGRLMESGPVESVFAHPCHPYTRDLINAEPRPDPRSERIRLQNRQMQSIDVQVEKGCVYQARCQYTQTKCRVEEPVLSATDNKQNAACFYPLSIP